MLKKKEYNDLIASLSTIIIGEVDLFIRNSITAQYDIKLAEFLTKKSAKDGTNIYVADTMEEMDYIKAALVQKEYHFNSDYSQCSLYTAYTKLYTIKRDSTHVDIGVDCIYLTTKENKALIDAQESKNAEQLAIYKANNRPEPIDYND